MTQFLGRQDCIDSLRRDLIDLQGAILDVFTKTGAVHVSSWKFPDKLSCNLDMVALLGQYDYVEGEEVFNQHAHIVLLELVIDRLLLLLQSFDAFVDPNEDNQPKKTTEKKECLSIGLVVIKYWAHLVQFSQEKLKIQELDSSNSTNPDNPCSADVSCQTTEIPLSPCNACIEVQSVLRQTGEALVGLFVAEGLPSSMQPLLDASEDGLDPGQMTDDDVAQWAGEQLRDLRRLGKHTREVRETVQPLKKRLMAAESETDKFRLDSERVKKQLKTEEEKYKNRIETFEKTLKSVKEKEEKMLEEQKQLREEIASLEKSNSTLEEKLSLHKQVHATEQAAWQEKVKILQEEEKLCVKLRDKIGNLESQLSELQLLYDREKAKYQSACRQQESMQVKQKSLLEHVDTLDVECEELQRQVGLKDEAEMELYSQLQQMSRERERVQAELTPQKDLCARLHMDKKRLEADVESLKKSVDDLQELVQSLRERERLLVAFPELSPLTLDQPQSTGNVLLDMEQQYQSNSIRIQVLERENATLHTSLVKLKERDQRVGNTSQPFPSSTSPAHYHMSETRTSSSRSGSEAGSSDLEYCRWSDDHTPTAAASPPSVKIHFQTLELKPDAPKASTRTHRLAHSAPSRVFRQRRK